MKTRDNSIEKRCVDVLRTTRWPKGIKCPRCDKDHILSVGRLRTYPEHKRYYCATCKYIFSDTSMTIFHGSRLSLKKWFDAIVLWAKGSSIMELKHGLSVTYKTAWRIKHLLETDSIALEIRRRLLKEAD